MKKLFYIIGLLAALAVSCMPAQAQFTYGQLVTASGLNAAFASVLPRSGGTLTGPLSVPSLSVTGAPIPFASGGTNATTATGATSQLQYLQGATGSVARSLANKLGDVWSATDFAGVDPTGVADSTAGIQAAINAVCAHAGGGALYIPQGSYSVSSLKASCSDIHIVGAGIGATAINGSSATANLFSFSGANNQGIRDLQIYYESTPTAGAAISITGVRNFSASRVKILNPFYGFDISGGAIHFYNDIELDDVAPTNGIGFLVGGGISDPYFHHIVMDNTPGSQPLAGMKLVNVGAPWIDSVDFIHSGIGLLLAPANSGDSIMWAFVSNSSFDTNSNYGIQFNPAVGTTIKGSGFVNNWTSTNTANGIWIGGAGNTDGLRFVAHRAYNNGQSGIAITNANAVNVEFDACDVAGNSTSSVGTYSGFDIGSGVGGFSITNSRSGSSALFNATQSRGIIVNPGASNNYVLIGNDVRGNLSNAIYDGGTGTTKIVKGNLGYNPIASTAITVTASPFTYTNNTGDTVNVFVAGGTVSSVTLGGNTVSTATNTVVPVPQGASVIVTYSTAPAMSYIGY